MKRWRGAQVGEAKPARQGAPKAPLNLIHTNKVPKPASMRVSGRCDFPEGLPLAEVQKTIDFAFGPLGWLMRRRADGTT